MAANERRKGKMEGKKSFNEGINISSLAIKLRKEAN